MRASSWPESPRRFERSEPVESRGLRLLRRTTGERFTGEYRGRRTSYDDYKEICWLMRDVRCTSVSEINPKLIDLMSRVQQELDGRELIINSGYRTRESNALLRRKGAAKHSFHMSGEAVDFFVRGVPTEELAKIVRRQRRGGVGVYPGRGFVHMDVGPLRAWRG